MQQLNCAVNVLFGINCVWMMFGYSHVHVGIMFGLCPGTTHWPMSPNQGDCMPLVLGEVGSLVWIPR